MTTPDITFTDPERAMELLTKEHDALAAMQGGESRRVDRLVQDVGSIKGRVESISGDVERVGNGVDRLMDSMAVLNKHAVLMEMASGDIAKLRAEAADLDKRTRVIETVLPQLVETRRWTVHAMLGVIATVAVALLALVIRK